MIRNVGCKIMTFGEYLRNLREKKGYSIRQLALYSGISNSYLSQVEQGKRGIPKPEYLQKLAKALEIEYDDLLAAAGYRVKPQIDTLQSSNKQISLEEALQELLNSDHVMFNGLPIGELDEETKEDLKTAVLAIMEYKAKHGKSQQQPKKAAAAARRSAMANGNAVLLSAAAS